MTRFIALAIIALLFLGPLRRPFLSNWRFTIPLTVGAAVGFSLAILYVRHGAPWFFLLVGPTLGMCLIGGAIKESFDKFFK